MQFKKTSLISLMLCLALIFGVGYTTTTLAADTGVQKDTADWKFHDIVGVNFVQHYSKMPQPKGVTIIDSRPYKGKYILGHIPTAINIPDSQFDKMTDKLPKDKTTLLIFYCQGPT